MRIVYFVHQFFPEFHSGTEHVVLNLARMAQRAGHHVQVLSCRLSEPLKFGVPSGLGHGARSGAVDGVPVTLLDRAALPGLSEVAYDIDDRVVGDIERWLRAQGFDVLHVLHSMRMASALAAAQRVGLPMVLTLTDFFLPCFRVNLIDLQGQACPGPDGGRRCATHCDTEPWNPETLGARYRQSQALLASAAVRVVPSNHVARRFEAAYPGMGFKVLAHGVDVLKIVNAKAASAPAGVLRLGFIGSIIPPKGLHILLQALALVPELKLRLRVIGAHHQGEALYRARIEAMLAADDRVDMVGPCSADQVAAEIAGLDLLCLPSLVPESFSLVVHECAARSVPCLVSDLGAPADLVRASGGGCVVATGDVDAWAQALRDVVTEPGLLASWREQVTLPLRMEEEAFLYESLYRQALATA